MSELTNAALGYEGGPAPEPEPVPPAEPAWAGPSQDEWEQTQQALQYYAQQIEAQNAPPPAAGEQQIPAVDFFDENAFPQLMGVFGQMLDERLRPFQEFQYGQQMGEAENRALDILEDIVARDGEFLEQEKAFQAITAMANVFMPEEAQKYGYGPQAAQAALERAAGEFRAYEKAVSEAAVARNHNQLSTLSGAPGEPGSRYSQGAQEMVVPNYREGGSVSDRIFGSGG